MARRVIIRSRSLNTDVARLEEMIKADYKEIYKEHIEDLEAMCEDIYQEAISLVPIEYGTLRDSIVVRVSKSYRYPGIIAHASAKDHGYDYALIQEENEEFSHEDDRQAHYLGGPFARALQALYEDLTGEEIELPPELQHAAEYEGE